MTTTTLPVSGVNLNQFYVSKSELFFIAQKGDDLKTVKEKVQKCPVAQDLPLVQKGLTEEVIENYNDLKSPFLSSGQWLAIPLIEEQIKMEEVMDLHSPGANLYKAIIFGGKAAKIEQKLAPILAEVETKINLKASDRKQEIEQLLESIRSQAAGQIQGTPEEAQKKLIADIKRLGELKSKEAFGLLVSLLESNSLLVSLLESNSASIDSCIKMYIVQALGQIGDKNCQEYLLKILQSPNRTDQDQYNKFNALRALENFSDPKVVKFLKQVATGKFKIDHYLSLEREAILTLASIYKRTGNRAAFAALRDLLNRESPGTGIRTYALEAFAEIGGEKSQRVVTEYSNRKDINLGQKYFAEYFLAKIEKRKYDPDRVQD